MLEKNNESSGDGNATMNQSDKHISQSLFQGLFNQFLMTFVDILQGFTRLMENGEESNSHTAEIKQTVVENCH
jgi:hypothetical protein